MERFSEYSSFAVGEGADRYTIGEAYGTETFCWFLYSVIRMEMPRTVVEIGSGRGISTVASALALKHNRHGTLWSVDDGSDWHRIRPSCQAALGYRSESEGYESFRERLLRHCDVSAEVRLISETAADGTYFAPPEAIDLLFVDAGDTHPAGCVGFLRFYLPRMAAHSSLFIDGASTYWDSYLFVERLVELLNAQQLPHSLRVGLSPEDELRLQELVRSSRFTLVHLVDRSPAKVNTLQNGRCWIQIRPCDVVADGTVPIQLYSY